MSRSVLRLQRRLSLLACLVFSAVMAHAQYRTSIQGVVTDTTGAVIPGATLTLTNPATGQKQVRTSGDDGIYNFNALPAGAHFNLVAEKPDFQKKEINNLQLVPDQSNAVNVTLVAGGATEVVQVNAENAPLLDTQTASVNGVVSDNQIQHMPSFGRDVLKLGQLAPGVFGDGSQGGGGGGYNLPGTETGGGASGSDQGIFNTENGAPVSANGQQTPANGVTIDGISTTSAVWGGTTVITPSEESIDSFKIVSNSYDAENGRFSGAQIQITSKSGTNSYHGSAFFTAHRPGLNAYQRFNGEGAKVLRDQSRFNQIGGSVGGPIIKNKLFAFFSYETIREHTSVIGNQWADTPAFDALATSGTIASTLVNYPGNGILNKGVNTVTCKDAGLVEGVNCRAVSGGLNVGTPLDPTKFPTGQVVAGQDPGWVSSSSPGTGGDGSGGPENLGTVADITNYITTSPTVKTDVQYNGRLDYDLTQKDRIGFAIYWVPASTDFNNGARALDVFHHNQINDAFAPIWNHTFSPTFLNEVRANAAGWRWNEITSNPQSPVGLPNTALDYSIGSASINSFGPNPPSHLNQWTYSFKDVATKIIGPHTIKFGGELTRLFYLNACFGCALPSYGFFNLWDFLNDAPRREGFILADPNTGEPTAQRQDDRENIWGFFAQDDYKLRKNLTLNLGLRWSYFGPLYSKENNMFVAVPGSGSSYLTGLNLRKGNSWNAQKNNFSPEIGFAWSPTRFHDKLVVRGGYGLNYNQEEIAISAGIQGNPGLSIGEYIQMATPTGPDPGILYATSSDPHNAFGYPPNPNFKLTFGPNGLPLVGTPQCPVSCPVGVTIFPGTLPTMRVHHYSLDTQYDLGHNFVASLGYQGSLSRDVLFHQNPLAVPAVKGYALNPQINGGDYWSSVGSGNYNALLAELKHNFSRQFMADTQFTWSKSLDNTSRPYTEPYYPYDPNLSYGRSDYNVGKAFKLFGMWQPVFFHGNKAWVEKIAGGWSLSGILNIHSGFPWSPLVPVNGGSLYCGQCGYGNLYPAAYLGGAGSNTSTDAFKTTDKSNFPLVATQGSASAYFSTPAYTPFNGPAAGTALPQAPGVRRNSLTGPGYKDVDLTLVKAFGLPNMRVLGENAIFEIRFDVYNVFNNLNLDVGQIVNDITLSNFGVVNSNGSAALAARTATLGARFSF
ncbi:MAG TPA: TonB-dependent receptor [Candidatus Sulfotelmatobacter sp.]|nr:TonB-dependent receptor [Candidatus Sulfotelmatobacter sp.]